MTEGAARPVLSIVVARISGRPEHLARCLEALRRQQDPPALEVIVPYDAADAGLGGLEARFPEVRFVPVTGLDSVRLRRGESREAHDTLRTKGIEQARGALVALTEDHACVAPNWCHDMLAVLEEHPEAAALGGAVECESGSRLNWAVWFCDFGRYQNPLPDGPSPFVSDSNVVYRREALEQVRESWRDDYHETIVHEALRSRGFELRLTPRTTVWQARETLAWLPALRERFVWGRSFAASRVHGRTLRARLPLAAVAPALPLLLTWRVVLTTLRRGRLAGPLRRALPALMVLHGAWAAGELAGYLSGRPR